MHNINKDCPMCWQIAEQKRIERQAKKAEIAEEVRKKELIIKMAFMTGDPMVTPGKHQESVNTLKDMYGIFNTHHNPKHRRKISRGRKSKSPS